MARERAHTHRGLFWSAVLLALLAVVGGGVAALRGYGRSDGPDGVARGYYSALAEADAPAALAYGDLPSGPHTLLTGKVLREQQRIAPIRDVQVVAVRRSGERASVSVRYRLDFPGAQQQVTDVLQLRERDGSWRLARTAVATELQVNGALSRATVVGAGIPAGTTLLFPGAVPISFDTDYLQLDPATGYVSFSSAAQTTVGVQVSPAGRDAVARVLQSMLHGCLDGKVRADPRCPLPSSRYMPGSVKATIDGKILDGLRIDVGDGGLLLVSGQVQVTGSYRELDFDNIAHDKSGTIRLAVWASGYPTGDLKLQWRVPS